LDSVHRRDGPVRVQTDRKTSYASRLAQVFGARLCHERYSSRAPRTYGTPLFPINHTLATMRDAVSRLVRRSWAASKLRCRLELHLSIWMAYRNYVRGITNRARRTTPAMALGIDRAQWHPADLLRWRVFEFA